MQDHYVGDIRDFAKYGLLRWLCGRSGNEPPLKLGVVWYRVKGAEVDKRSKGNRAKKRSGGGGGIDCYLWPEDKGCHRHEFCDALRACGQGLAGELKSIRKRDNRTVVDVEESKVLGKQTVFFEKDRKADFWTFEGCGDARTRRERREAAFNEAFDTVSRCDLVFLDPDNGIETRGIERFSSSPNKLKYVQWREARGFYAPDARSLVLIQFLNANQERAKKRRVSYGEQVKRRKGNLSKDLEEIDQNDIRTVLFCFRGCSGCNPHLTNGPPLVFFIVPRDDHKSWIDERLHEMIRPERWGRFVSLGGGKRPKGMNDDLCRGCNACDA